MHQLVLCEEIEQQWPTLIPILRKSNLSASTPMVRKKIFDRAVVPRLTLRDLARLRAHRFVGTRYYLRTDINQFYSSIYTHSIPWAIHGKVYAKQNVNKTPGDQLDKALRDQNQGQTIGIPIGPDTSLIIAEIILSVIDARLAAKLAPRGLRYVDDYEMGFESLADAETALTYIQGALAEYELVLNPRKTRIEEGPASFQDSWLIELAQFRFRAQTPSKQLNDAVAFFSRSSELAKQYPQLGIFRYATVAAQRWRFPGRGWRTFEALLLNVATADPAVLPNVVVLLQNHVAMGQSVNKNAMSALIESTIARHAPLGHGSEVSWAIWAALQFSIPMTTMAANAVADMEDDIVALLALDANARQLFPANSLGLMRWNIIASLPNALMDEHWLPAYEADKHGWLQTPAVASDPFFKSLKSNNISFYDASTLLTAFSGAAGGIPGGTLPTWYQ